MLPPTYYTHISKTRRQQPQYSPSPHQRLPRRSPDPRHYSPLYLTYNATMCCYMASQHICGHLHEWFARCYQAKHDQTDACAMQTIPTWHYPERFACPACRTLNRINTQNLIASNGRQANTGMSTNPEKPKQAYSRTPVPRLHAAQSAHSHSAQPSGEARLQTLAKGALNLPSAHTPWIPPSRRQPSIVGQLGPSPPPQVHANDSASTHSSEMLSVESSSRPGSETSPTYSLQEQVANRRTSIDDKQFARLLRQDET